jgi:hypothetical protein
MRGGSYRYGRVGFFLRGAIVLGVLMLRPLTADAAPVLVGDSVEAGLFSAGLVVTPLTSPAVVSSGVEFTGVVQEPGSNGGLWDVWVDIGASSFSIGWTSRGSTASIIAPFTLIGLTLGGLDFTPAATITGVTRTDYSCTPAGSFACGTGGVGPIDPVLFFTEHVISLDFTAIRTGEVYTFDIATTESTATPVPEPGSLALLGAGLATFIGGRYRRRGAEPSPR